VIPAIDGGAATRLDWIAKLIREQGVRAGQIGVVILGPDHPWLTCDRCGARTSIRIATSGNVIVCAVADTC
jgi:hypothetical protein